MKESKIRTITLYKNHFNDFYQKQRQKVKDKILWTFKLIETTEQIPKDYFEHIKGTDQGERKKLLTIRKSLIINI